MAEKWRVQDSARTMTQKYNALVEEINNMGKIKAETEKTNVTIDSDLTDDELDRILFANRG